MASKISINLDTSKENFLVAKCKQNDDLTLEASIFENGLEKDLTNAAITIQALKADKTYIIQNTDINKLNNKITANLIRDFSRVPGTTKIEIVLVESGKQNTTFNFYLDVVGSVIRGAVESSNTVTILEELGNKIVEAGQVRDETEQLIQSGGAATTGDIQEINSQLAQKANKTDVKNKYYDIDVGLIGNKNLDNITFKRKHARNMYKNLKYKMSGMDLTRDFLNAENGNMYPQQNYLVSDYGTELIEEVNNFKYKLRNETTSSKTSKRLIGCINIFSTYEITITDIVTNSDLGVRCGIDIRNSIDLDKYDIFVAVTRNGTMEIRSEMSLNDVPYGVVTNYTESFTDSELTILFTITDSWVEVYKKVNGNISFLCKINLPRKLNNMTTLADTKVNLFTRLNQNESVSYTSIENYYDCGISQGDTKVIKYKDGQTLIKDGRIYFTMSSRFQESAYQTIISQNINGCDYRLEGVILFTTDNQNINRDFACSIKYDNDTGKFLIWNTSFTGRHNLTYGEAYCDIMHGINIVSMTSMEDGLIDDTDFKAKFGDEDPDFVYNYETKKWNMIICRLVYDEVDKKDQYRYFLFESDEPFKNYVFKDKTLSGTNTGGSIVKVGGKYYLVCGSNYHTVSQYNVYSLDNLSTHKALKKDYADGGYRGWGTIFTIPCGNFTRYGWITFDRDSASDYKWSYGNLYYYESDLLNAGCEYNVKYSY